MRCFKQQNPAISQALIFYCLGISIYPAYKVAGGYLRLLSIIKSYKFCKFVNMIRTIVKPRKNSLTLQLPDYLVGKTVEVIAFEIDGDISSEPGKKKLDKEKRMQEIEKGLSNYRIDLSGFKFNRDEANDYD